MASLCRLLAQAMQERGGEIRTFMPRWGTINERRNQLHEVIRLSGMNLIINDNDHQLIIKVASIPSARVQIYFIDNEDYFSRKAILTDDDGVPFPDNDERALFFARGVLETVRKLRWAPDIVHCHGWFTGLVPMYLRGSFANDPLFRDLKIVASLHDDAFPGSLDPRMATKMADEGAQADKLKIISQPTYENLMKLVIDYADGVVVDTPTPDKAVKDYASASGKPVLEYGEREDTVYLDKYRQFYDDLLAR
jgi:starch synthase